MPSDVLTLGGIAFDGFSTPSAMGAGGKQAMVVHKLPGGSRVVDTLGPDEDNISWSGEFFGNDAYANVLALDGMRAAGQVISLQFGEQFRYVIIDSFNYHLRREPVWIEYQISCLVYQNPALGNLGSGISGIDSLVLSDLGAAEIASLAGPADALTIDSFVRAFEIAGLGNVSNIPIVVGPPTPPPPPPPPSGGPPIIQPPVVNSSTVSGEIFSLSIPVTLGATVGTVTATNSPTSWAILLGDPGQFFAINNLGVITVTAAGVSGLTAGNYTLTVQATNASTLSSTPGLPPGVGTGSVTIVATAAVFNGWVNTSVTNQTGQFQLVVDAVPQIANINTTVGLGNVAAAANFSDIACIVRFNSSGTIDARNGAIYSANTTLNYTSGTSYHIRMVGNVAAHTYDVFVTPAGGAEIQIASGYAFRTEQNTITNINTFSVSPSSFPPNTVTTSGLAITTVANTPVVTAASFSITLPDTAGQAIGTLNATNNPSSWSITSVS